MNDRERRHQGAKLVESANDWQGVCPCGWRSTPQRKSAPLAAVTATMSVTTHKFSDYRFSIAA